MEERGGMKTKTFMREIERAGAVLLRTKGSHKIYKLGRDVFALSHSGSHTEVSTGVEHKIRRILKANGVSV